MTIAQHHAEWLSLLEISGPFISLPVLLRTFPQGLDAPDAELLRDLRAVYEEWLDNQGGLQPQPAIHRAWALWVLQRVLEFPAEVLHDSDALDDRFQVHVAEHGEVLAPDFAVVAPDFAGVALNDPATARLLVQVVPPGQGLDRRLRDARWSASPATRMMALLHATGVRLGLVTNGEQWMLVDAPKDNTTGFISWYAELWLDEDLTLRAFRSLLGVRRFFAVPDEETVEALLAASADDQQEMTDQLGAQVRAAVEVLIQALDLADRDTGGTLLAGRTPQTLYEAALKVMMRLVFLLSAEERGLLPLEDPLYAQHYAVSTLRARLREAADHAGEEVLERRHDAWSRLLATFRAVHGGIRHDRLTLPAYGGSLFDPDELPFLEGRAEGASWQDTEARPLPIDNRTVLHLLAALQMLQVRVPGGGAAEARRISFRALDIEQIGHVYEGLLDHTAKRAPEPLLGLDGTVKCPDPLVALPDLAAQQAAGEKAFVAYLAEQTGRSASALRKQVQAELDLRAHQDVSVACGNDEALIRRVLPFAGLLRADSYGRPVFVPAGSLYVTAGATRRATGTHYTPRSLTEPIVQHTLEPLVYEGPAQGKPRGQWRLRAPGDLLALKVCDMAMGSGAFLVQACRYLSERLVEAVEEEATAKTRRRKVEKEDKEILASLQEATSDEERLAMARRLVADRCLYGVDKNPLAVEMAKLSLWLITLDKGRPFTFLDHALKAGDSIVGVDLEQLLCWSLEGRGERKFETLGIQADIERMIALRREIAATPVRDTRDQAAKRALLAEADAIATHLKAGADMLVGAHYNTLSESDRAPLRDALLRAFRDGTDVPPELAPHADLGDLVPFHWPLEFPEVFGERGGFDAFVGNPPFIGGRRIRETLGDRYRELLYAVYPGSSGNADYCAFFFLRAFAHLRQSGCLSLIATNTIAQGDTRSTGLDLIIENGGTIYRATNNQPWPGAAAVVVDVVSIAKAKVLPPFSLDGESVTHISALLDNRKVVGSPHRLSGNSSKCYMGTNVVGSGFILSMEEAAALIKKNSENATVISPYLTGQDLNSYCDQSASRKIIDFSDWPLDRGRGGSWEKTDDRQRKTWIRSGIVPNDYPYPVAADYTDCLAIVRTRVKPYRDKVRRKVYRELWWQFGEKQKALYTTISSMKRVLAVAQTSRTLAFAFVPNGWVYAMMTIIFAFEDYWALAVLQSSWHEAWARSYASTMKQDLRYTPTDVFETFPLPHCSDGQRLILNDAGEGYHTHRGQLMLDRQEGLTATYNRFHDPAETAADIARLRELHVEMDQTVAAAYGWDDLELDHGFHETPQGLRFTISEPARWEVLDRLLALNHQRHAEEVAAAQAREAAGKGKKKPGSRRAEEAAQGTLFEL